MLMVLLSAESHSMMVRIFRSHGAGGRWRWVSRAFFRWWKSPSVRVYLREGTRGFRPESSHPSAAGPYRRALSCVIFSCSYRADSLKETLRPTAPPVTKRSESPSWQLEAESASDSSRRRVISEGHQPQGRA